MSNLEYAKMFVLEKDPTLNRLVTSVVEKINSLGIDIKDDSLKKWEELLPILKKIALGIPLSPEEAKTHLRCSLIDDLMMREEIPEEIKEIITKIREIMQKHLDALNTNLHIKGIKDFSAAKTCLNDMAYKGMPVDIITINTVLNKATSFSEATGFLNEVRNNQKFMGISFDDVTVATLLDKAENWNQAMSSLHEIETDNKFNGIVLNSATALIIANKVDVKNEKEFEKLLVFLRDPGNQGKFKKSPHEIVIATILMSKLFNKMNFEQLTELLVPGSILDYVPCNTVTLNIVLNKIPTFEGAVAFLDPENIRDRFKGIPLDKVTVFTLQQKIDYRDFDKKRALMTLIKTHPQFERLFTQIEKHRKKREKKS